MHLLLIRHGQSQNNLLEAAHGAGSVFNANRSVDPPLSELGLRQAELLGKHLGAQLYGTRSRIRLIVSSMTRALQTIQPLSKRLGIAPTVNPDMHEVKGFYCTKGGTVNGSGASKLAKEFPGFDVTLIPEDGQGNENCNDAFTRAKRTISMLRNLASAPGAEDEVVIIVSHNDYIALLAKLLLVPSGKQDFSQRDEPEDIFTDSYWPMNNTGISHFVLGVKPPAGAYQVDTYLLYWNRSDHLNEELRSGVQFKNMGFSGAAEWARVGQGGSGIKPKFVERETVWQPWWVRPYALAALCVGVGAVFALRRL